MQCKLDKGAHSVYSLQYHVVQVIKYMRKVMNEKIIDLLKQKIHEISETFLRSGKPLRTIHSGLPHIFLPQQDR